MHVPASRNLLQFVILRLAIPGVLFLALMGGIVSAQGTPATDTTPKKKIPPYALIFGTLYDAHNQPLYGVAIKIRRADQKKAKWELMSDHQGEFAQRVPAGKADYVVWAEVKGGKG